MCGVDVHGRVGAGRLLGPGTTRARRGVEGRGGRRSHRASHAGGACAGAVGLAERLLPHRRHTAGERCDGRRPRADLSTIGHRHRSAGGCLRQGVHPARRRAGRHRALGGGLGAVRRRRVHHGAADLHGGHGARRDRWWLPRHAPLHAGLRPLANRRPQRGQLHLHRLIQPERALRRRQPPVRRHARRLPRQRAHARLSRRRRNAPARRHGDHHLRRPFRRQQGFPHGDHFLGPNAAAALLGLRRFRPIPHPAHPTHRGHWRRDRRRAWLRTVGGAGGRAVRPLGTRPRPALQPRHRRHPRLGSAAERRTIPHLARRRPRHRHPARRHPRRARRAPLHHLLDGRRHRRRGQSGVGGSRAGAAHLLGRHPRPLRVRRGRGHTRPLHDLGARRRAAGLCDPLRARHLAGCLRVGRVGRQRAQVQPRQGVHRLPGLRVDSEQLPRRAPQRVVPHPG